MQQGTVLSFAECLFTDGNISESREHLLTRAEGLYRQHINALVASYFSLSAWLRQIQADCLTPAQCKVLNETDEPDLDWPFLSEANASASSTTRGDSDGVRNGHGPGLRKYLDSKFSADVSPRSIAMHFAYDMNLASCRILGTWHRALNVLLHVAREVTSSLRETWEKRIAERWSVSLVREINREDIATADKVDVCETHHIAADNVRNKGEPQSKIDVEDMSLIPKLDVRPLIFEQKYGRQSDGTTEASVPCAPSVPKPYRGVHLFVLVHGFQGNSFDMRLMKNNLALLYPDSIFLCSTSNEDNTEGDINEMGIRLAQEVVNYICDWCPGSALGRLSFVAHSLGGLITRAALPLLHEYSSKMFTFLSFSSSHLGILQDKISLFNTGFWVLKQWRKSQFLQQVSMTDHSDPRETFLYKLSKAKGFEFFQNVILVSCYEDQYGPFPSARAEISRAWENQPNKEVYTEMVKNIWGPVQKERLTRFDVNFVIPEKNLDAFIGRAAHIQFLECQPIMKMLIHNYSHLFR